jgi:hypothetical protein
MARVTGLEPATSGVTGRHSNRLSYTRAWLADLSAPRREGCLRDAIFTVKQASTPNPRADPQRAGRRRGGNSRREGDGRETLCSAVRQPNDGPARAISSVGRAPRLHRGCRRFDSVIAHHISAPTPQGSGRGRPRRFDGGSAGPAVRPSHLQMICRKPDLRPKGRRIKSAHVWAARSGILAPGLSALAISA